MNNTPYRFSLPSDYRRAIHDLIHERTVRVTEDALAGEVIAIYSAQEWSAWLQRPDAPLPLQLFAAFDVAPREVIYPSFALNYHMALKVPVDERGPTLFRVLHTARKEGKGFSLPPLGFCCVCKTIRDLRRKLRQFLIRIRRWGGDPQAQWFLGCICERLGIAGYSESARYREPLANIPGLHNLVHDLLCFLSNVLYTPPQPRFLERVDKFITECKQASGQ